MGTRPPAIGRRYTLKRQIGGGGMGSVWLAVDEVLDREVAVKRVGLFPEASSSDLLRAQREAKLAARLNHPHVVSVFDFVTEGDEQWLVMEYVAGTNLSALVEEQGGLPPADAAAMLGQAAEALAAAHSAGIVHRDVKPSNILVTPDRTAKLADFGVARARADVTRTASAIVTGTPAYLAPEVASGRTATEASDVWSLGATLYYALTGRPPYDVSGNVLDAMYRIVHEDPPRLTGMAWPADLLEVTMATDPAQRWPMSRVREYLVAGPDAGMSRGPTGAAATTVLPAVPAPEAMGPVEAADQEQPSDEPRQRGSRLPILIGIGVMLVAAVVGWALLRGAPAPTGTDRLAGAGSTPSTTPESQPSPTSAPTSRSPRRSPSPTRTTATARTTPPAATTAPESPDAADQQAGGRSGAGTAQRMRTFVEDYVATALTDPATAWQQLSPGFQERVGSYGSYAGFWDTIETATLRDVDADPQVMEVSYVITWDPEGERAPEDEFVVLELVEVDGRYLIDGER